MVWEPVINLLENEIVEKGYFHWRKSFQEFKREHSIIAPLRAPAYLSLDFYSQQRPELKQRGWYVIRLGRGHFCIFNRNQFPEPYLKLPIEGGKEITVEPVDSYTLMRKAFKELDYSLKSAENSLLELARFYSVFSEVVHTVDGSNEYQVGPRGLTTQKFNLYFKRSDNGYARFEYDGQVELDYSIWTENRVFVVEAKSINRNGRDIGWHKMAFPSRRFIKQAVEDGFKINPVYFLRTRSRGRNLILIYVFNEMQFMDDGGVVLNDDAQWRLLGFFKVDVDSIDRELG